MARSSGRRLAGLLCLALCVAASAGGCSSQPFVVDPPTESWPTADPLQPPLGPHDYDPRPRPVSLCYSSQMNTPEQVIERARELCPNQGSLRFYGEDALFNDCSLLQPYRVTFICTPGPPPPSPYD